MNENHYIVLASEAGLHIGTLEAVFDAIGACYGADGLLLTEQDLGSDFFDLRTGLAGELFQKLVNYNIRTAIVLADFEAHGKRFSELALEHASHGMIRFVHVRDEAMAWLNHGDSGRSE